MMVKPVLFTAYCSRTRRKFFVEGVQAENLLVWKRAYTMMGDGQGIQGKGEITASQHDTSQFKCPCCGANSGFWFCNTCSRSHCMGQEQGIVFGGCGTCAHSVSSFRPITDVRMQLSDGSKV